MCGVSSPSSSGSRYTAEVTILMVTSNQAKTKLAGAIFQGLSLRFLFAQPLHCTFLALSAKLWIFLGDYSPEFAVTTRRSTPLLLQPSKHSSNELGASLWP